MNTVEIRYDEIEGASFLRWPPAADSAIKFAVNPPLEDFTLRLAKIESSMVGPLRDFLRGRGFGIRVPEEDVEYRQKKAEWADKLRYGCNEYTDLEILSYLESLGVDFRAIQEQGILLSLRNHITLLSAICGSGKTIIMLTVLQFLKDRGGVRALILSPNTATGVYSREVRKFAKYFDLTIEDLSCASNHEIQCRFETTNCDIVVLPYSKVHSFTNELRAFTNRFHGRETVLLPDEAHALKNVKSRVSKSVRRVAPFFGRVILSTATPMPKGPKDVRGYLSLVSDPLPEQHYRNEIPPEDYQILEGMAFVSGEEDLSYAPVDKVKFTYRNQGELDSHLVAEISREIEAGRKAIIFCTTNAAISHVYNKFPEIGKAVLSGTYHTDDPNSSVLLLGRKPECQQKAIDQFNRNPECKLLIANYRVGSTGLNLQESGARIAFFYEITTNGADFYQSKFRIRRPYIFPEGGFRYIYAIPSELRLRRQATRQFAKLDSQQALLDELKLNTRKAP
ncbi:MAG: DEAD/DEAH box helicase [Bdellovibrionaceae bacterium]|nr:DEAD/DEAH box helicase [Pseudobdellovibrionaceae bacterium]